MMHLVTVVAVTQMKFAKFVALAAIIMRSCFSGQATIPQLRGFEIGEEVGEKTPLTSQIVLEISGVSQIGKFILQYSHIGSIVSADAFPSRQSAR
jgi:hypothetical protein